MDDFEVEEEVRHDYPCPYCYEEFDIASLCSHLEAEHSYESKASVSFSLDRFASWFMYMSLSCSPFTSMFPKLRGFCLILVLICHVFLFLVDLLHLVGKIVVFVVFLLKMAPLMFLWILRFLFHVSISTNRNVWWWSGKSWVYFVHFQGSESLAYFLAIFWFFFFLVSSFALIFVPCTCFFLDVFHRTVFCNSTYKVQIMGWVRIKDQDITIPSIVMELDIAYYC